MVCVCAFSVRVNVLIGVCMMSVCLFNIIDFICFLLIVCVFRLAVHVEDFILALAVCVFLMCVC